MSSRKEETRTALLEAARRLIEERRASDVRLADIARAAGVTRQGLYLHFGSRTELLLALVDYVDRNEGLGDWHDVLWSAASGREALDRFVELHAAYTPRIYQTARVLLSGRHTDDAIAAAWDDRMRGRWGTCKRLVDWLAEDGDLDPHWNRAAAADALWAITSIQIWEQLVVDKSWPAERYEQHLKRVLQRILIAG